MRILVTNFKAAETDTVLTAQTLAEAEGEGSLATGATVIKPSDALHYRADGQRHCIGYWQLKAEGGFTEVPCPWGNRIKKGTQCYRCGRADESWQIHNTTREQASPTLTSYLDRPHFLYVAVFADGSLKVGTSRSARKLSRWIEQGAVMTVRLGEYADGWEVREAENLASKQGGIKQAVRTVTKAKGFLSDVTVGQLAGELADTATEIAGLLDAYGLRGEAVGNELGSLGASLPEALAGLADMDPWVNPVAIKHLGEPLPAYPHELTTGEHNLELVDLVGTTAFVRINEPPEGAFDLAALSGEESEQLYVANFAQLKAFELEQIDA
ncbi:DUF2797 domain-containing protein [Boudabousia marimammalium]|uniref:DUF2797 domain-containing protein n=1 Tax=Boudabousia marimammalium TaxID=156892 RepID=A0A1Q5PMN9_9ACTO|nr:DUF2797 domain-containing protein [Boudabousia marimammalium]OKL48710.1 hypothetical protein BM477_05810 [Boudabousia marimammalium]